MLRPECARMRAYPQLREMQAGVSAIVRTRLTGFADLADPKVDVRNRRTSVRCVGRYSSTARSSAHSGDRPFVVYTKG